MTEEKIVYWSSVALGGLALVLLVVNISLINSNRNLQQEINQRQLAINTGTQLAQVNRNVVQALAEAAVKEGDSAARELLAAQGITVGPPKGGERKQPREIKEDVNP